MKTGENEDEPKGKFRWQKWLAIILLFVGLGYLIKLISGNAEDKTYQKPGKFQDQVIAVAAAEVGQEDFPVYLTGLGTVTPLRTVTVRSRVDGELTHIAFKEGQMVREGDLLAEIDPRAFQVQLMQAEGQLSRDKALLENAKADLARYKTLLQQDSIAPQQAVTQDSLVKQYKGTVEMDKGTVAIAKLQLSYARIRAPISGRMGLRLVDQGNIVHASDTVGLAVITQIQPIAVVFTLPEDNLPSVLKQIRSGNTVGIEAYDRSDRVKLAEGQLLAVDNQIDTNTGTIKLKGQFNNNDLTLFSNQFVNIKIHMETLQSVTTIPTAAIQRGVNGTFAYVVKDDQTVSIRPLTLGPTEGEKVAVLSGLKLDERVVTDGADKLRENMKVKLISRELATPTNGPAPASGIELNLDKNRKAEQ